MGYTGVGKPTERNYFYREEPSPFTKLNVSIDTSVIEGEIVSLLKPTLAFNLP